MKKFFIAGVLVLLAGGAAAGVWTWRQSLNPVDQARSLIKAGDLRGAQLVLRNAVLNDPSNAAAHYSLGSLQLRLGDPIAAEKELKDARKAGYDAAAIANPLAQAYLGQGKFTDVLAEFPADKLPPGQAATILVDRGLAELGLKHPDAAQASITEAEKLDPHQVGAPLAAARVELARGDAAAAERDVDQALQLDGHAIEALQMKAALLDRRGEHTQAVAVYDTAVGLAPNSIRLRLGRAAALIGAREDARAAQDDDFVLKADPRNQLAIYQQAVLLIRAKEWARADADLLKLSLVLSRLPRGDYFQALVKANLNQLEQATDAATRYVARTPDDVDGYRLLASIDLAAHRPGDAVDALKRAVGAGKADTVTLRLLATAYARSGHPELATQTLERAASLAPDDPAVLAQLAGERLQTGDAGNAVKDLQHSLELAPTSRASTGTTATLVVAQLEAGDLPQAAVSLDRLRSEPNVSPTVISTLTGLLKLAQFDLPGAQAAFEESLKGNPDALPARLNLAKVLALQGKATEAEKLLEDSLAKQPANVAILSNLVPILLALNQPGQAAAVLEAGHAAAPANLTLTIALADLDGRMGNPRKALDLLAQVPREQAATPAVLAARARSEQALGQSDEAQNAYRQILEADPANLPVRRELALLQAAANNPDAAKATLRDGLAVQPGNAQLLGSLVAVTARAGGLDAGVALAGQLEKIPADLPAAYVLAGDLYMSARRYDAAAAAYAAEFKAAPSPALALRTAIAVRASGDAAKAASLLRDWLAQHPDDLTVTQALGSLDLEAGHLDAAQADFAKILAARPNDAPALNNLALVYQKRNDARARETAQRAYLISPQPQIADTLGWILVNAGDPVPALLLLKQAANQLRGDPAVQYHLAVALRDAGQRPQALAVLKDLPGTGFAEKPDADRLLQELSQP